MGHEENLLALTRSHYKELKRQGLNPFDLFAWEPLKNFWTNMVHAGRRGDFTDRKLQQISKDMIWSALERKAEAYQAEENDERYVEELEELKDI